jgi:hypothetical protein
MSHDDRGRKHLWHADQLLRDYTTQTPEGSHIHTRRREFKDLTRIVVSPNVVLDGLVVSVPAIGPKVRGFKPGRGR